MSDEQLRFFLKSFNDAAKAVQIDSIALGQAENALSELWNVYSPRVNNAKTLSPYYADHGKEHPVRLGRKCAELFLSEFVSKDRSYHHVDVRSLLLAFASFLFHDIGMCIPPKGSDLVELAKTQGIRDLHDERSLEFIESELVRKHDTFLSWNAFWGDSKCVGKMPTPAGQVAFLLLARICKSHGDADSIWLKDGSLDSYSYRTSDIVVKFEDFWNADWETIKPVIYTAATILCLCDLCDIDSYRFEMSPEDLSSLLPSSAESRKWSLIHYISHQVGEVNFNKKHIVVDIHAQSDKIWSHISIQFCGAISDLLHWGGKQAFVSRIKEHLNPDFSNVQVRKSTNDDKRWRGIIEYIGRETFDDCFQFREINNKFEPRLGSDALFLSLVFLGISKSIQRDLGQYAGGVEYDFYMAVLLMLKKGLLIDSSISLSSIVEASIYDFILPDVNKCHETKVSRFIAGLNLAKNLIARIKRYMSVRVASFSSPLMSELRMGNVSDLRDTILLIDIRNEQTNDRDTYALLFELNDELKRNNVYLIFIGNGFSDYFDVDAKNSSKIQVEYNKDVIDVFVNNQSNFVRTANPSAVSIDLPTKKMASEGVCSPGDAVAALWCRGAGYVEFITQIQKQIKDRTTPRAMSILALLTLSECLATKNGLNDSIITVKISKLEKAFRNFTGRFPDGTFDSFSNSLGLLPNDFIDRANGVVTLPSAVLKNLDPSKIELSEHNWFQAYIGAILLQSEEYFNPLAGVLHSNTISIEHARKFLLLLEDTADFSNEAKVVLGTAFGEFLGKQICRDDSNFSWISSLFYSKKFSNDLNQCLHFQIVYRVARRFLDFGKLVSESEIPSSPAARLGLLEAICRHYEASKKLDAASEILVNSIIEKASTGRHKLEKMVVFDILWKYCKDFYMNYKSISDFVNDGKDLGWHTVAEIFHKQPMHEGHPQSDGRIREWFRFRQLFHFVLENTPNELRRSRG